MPCARTALLPVLALLAGCAANPETHTLAELRSVEPDVTEVRVENSLDHAMLGYREFLETAPESALTPEAMRRLADLKLEKEYGILGDGELVELPAPETTVATAHAGTGPPNRPRPGGMAAPVESEEEFERRALHQDRIPRSDQSVALPLPNGKAEAPAGPLEAIELYDRILATYPTYRHNDQVLYQKARAYDELGRTDAAIAVMERLISEYPHSRHIDEVQFRRAEYFFVRRNYLDAEEAYSAITERGVRSEYYELALYKLGWTLYKQELYQEAIREYISLLDYKVATGYDFDRSQDEADERRIADTFRVISLGFSSLGGSEVVEQYFVANGPRGYEDRIYSQLGEFYFEKLRYHDAAATYQAFVALHPLHRVSPHFGMRVAEIYEAGGFPQLVLEAKKEFAANYGLQSQYWRHFDVAEAPEVLRYLKVNLADLANHYHALYQQAGSEDEKIASFDEALHWYRAYLASFPEDLETPSVNYRLADLLLENHDFAEAAREYERTAYDYPAHEQAAAAGYAAIYAHREHQEVVEGAERQAARRAAVTSTLEFVDTFPEHAHAATVLGAAVDDLYEMNEYALAIATGRRLLEGYPEADPAIRRSAWAAIAHSSFDLADYAQAEHAYAQVLEMTRADDESRPAVVDRLAAAIYKQGEQASLAEDHRAAADHFLRVSQAAPGSSIRPVAAYDAGAALIRVEDWAGAAEVLDGFRGAYPDHELNREATRQLAFVYRKAGDLSRAAAEHERVAAEAEDPELRREALLAAGDLYEDSNLGDRALAVYLSYVSEFPKPVETAAETRFKVAKRYDAIHDEPHYHDQLRQIVAIDRAAGEERTPRLRYLGAQAALILAETHYERFSQIELAQPFEAHLQQKQQRMDEALEAFGELVDYEIGEVTAAATFYMAEIYYDFSQALIESERPSNLDPSELQEYEMALDEEAFPFEEKAIEVHEKNRELMATGLYNSWIEKSLTRLAGLMPGRYAKLEASPGFIGSIDRYAYRPPSSPRTNPATPVVHDSAASPLPGSRADSDAEADAAARFPAATESELPASQADSAGEAGSGGPAPGSGAAGARNDASTR